MADFVNNIDPNADREAEIELIKGIAGTMYLGEDDSFSFCLELNAT